MIYDLIFWHTGWMVWAGIGLILAIAILIAFIAAVGKVYYASRQWRTLQRAAKIPGDAACYGMRQAYQDACRKHGEPFGDPKKFIKFLHHLTLEIHKNAALPGRTNFEARGLTHRPWTKQEAADMFTSSLTEEAVEAMDEKAD
jgi:hypothetical protein